MIMAMALGCLENLHNEDFRSNLNTQLNTKCYAFQHGYGEGHRNRRNKGGFSPCVKIIRGAKLPCLLEHT